MEPDRWQRLWTLFHGALERPAGEARRDYLDASCDGDPSLRAELDSLIATHEAAPPQASSFGSGTTLKLGPEKEIGTEVGPYRLLRRIGEGGMGIVYEAQQLEPVRRRVALKLIRAGMDSLEVVRRFEAERQALALMDHSSIARVFDAGTTPEGRPYFAMELVDGPALTDFCDAWRLPVARRVALAATVCRAVHSAHQKGVIHRDLKASNVLVAAEEGGPVPKVIDFGIARAVARPYEEGSLHTRLGELVGTPETMSPEQASMSPDLDTRTDVYSLGALLYELLTGTRAFEFRETPFPEMLRRIREVEPAPPSARFAAQTPGATERAALRGGTPRTIRRELKGELDWIVARAMAKERERRYGSAADLAADLERHLEGQPVAAGPPSGLYRARKFLERHRFESAAAAALLLALGTFGVMTALQSRRLERALANEARERATANQVSEFLVALLEQPDPAIARGSDPTVKQALEWGASRIERDLAAQPEIQARLLETIGRVQFNLGAWDKAEPVLAKALELRRRLRGREHPEVATVLQLLAELEFDRARYERSLAYAEEALALRRRLLPPNDPAIAESLDVLALLRRRDDDMAAAEALHREALAIRVATFGESHPSVAESHNFLGIVRRQSGDLAQAEASYRQALTIWRSALGADHPKTAMAMNNLALTLHVRGDHRAASELFEELVPLRRKLLGDSHPDLMVTLSNQAKLLHDMNDLAGAEAVYRDALAIGRRSVGDEHPNTAAAWADLSSVLVKLGQLDEASTLARRSLAVRERIYGPGHAAVAASFGYLAEVEEARGDLAAADALHERAVAILRAASAGAVRIAEALETQGLFLVRRGEPERALPLLDEATELLAAALPESDRRRARLDAARGHCLARLGRRTEGEPLLTSALARLAAFETTETTEARAWLAESRDARAPRREG